MFAWLSIRKEQGSEAKYPGFRVEIIFYNFELTLF